MTAAPDTVPQPWGAYRPGGLAAALVWLSRTTILGRGAVRKLLYAGFRALHPGPVDVSLFGARVRLHPTHNVSERKALMRPDRMDPREHALLAERMSAAGAVFVDVGANAGLYSLDAALRAGAGARILSIDPNPDLLSRLAFNLATARADARVRPDVALIPFAVAISDRDGVGVLAGGSDEGSRSLERTGQGTEVRLRPLAALVAEAGVTRIDVMKIDVEGHEDKVLPPFLAAAPRALWPRLVVIEHLARAQWSVDCIADAQQRGYRVLLRTSNNTVLERLA
jgi:FkbM family methyltransferase